MTSKRIVITRGKFTGKNAEIYYAQDGKPASLAIDTIKDEGMATILVNWW